MPKCFFCDIQLEDKSCVIESDNFIARFDDFPISKGHLEIFPKKHIVSFFDLPQKQILDLSDLIQKTKNIIDNKYRPDGYNIGFNEGRAAGRTLDHFHIHIIPRYIGDVKNPAGGIRNIIPSKADYTKEAKKLPHLKKYFQD